jgi:hypothetical protein
VLGQANFGTAQAGGQTRAEIDALLADGRRNVEWSYGLFTAGAAAVAAGAWMAFMGGGDKPPPVSVAPAPGGLAVSVALR